MKIIYSEKVGGDGVFDSIGPLIQDNMGHIDRHIGPLGSVSGNFWAYGSIGSGAQRGGPPKISPLRLTPPFFRPLFYPVLPSTYGAEVRGTSPSRGRILAPRGRAAA